MIEIVPIILAILFISFWGFLANQAMKEEKTKAPCNSCWWLKFMGILQVIVYSFALLGAIGFTKYNVVFTS